MKSSRKSTKQTAMTKVTYPTKEEWMQSTSKLLVERHEQIAAYGRDRKKAPKGLFEIVGEIHAAIEQRSRWTEKDFDIWRNAPMKDEVGYERYVRDYPHLQSLWED
jgi:hypothetical protein